ncbi:MAG: Ig-like domain-containing protein, partial [Acidimicrobiia bacterium]
MKRFTTFVSALLAALFLLAAVPTSALAAECGCQETGEYETAKVRQPAQQELSPGGGEYRLKVTQTSVDNQLRIEKAGSGEHVKTFFVPLARLDWGFSPDGHRFMVSHKGAGDHLDDITLWDLEANRLVKFTTVTSGFAGAFSPHGRWFLVNDLRGPGQSATTIYDAVTGGTALYAEMAFENPPGGPGDKFGVIGGGFGPGADDRSYVWAYRQIGGNIQLNLRNLATRQTVLSRPVGIAWWRFSPCGDILGLVNQTDQGSTTVSMYKTAAPNQTLGVKTFSPIPDHLVMESTLASHQVRTFAPGSGEEKVTVVGQNTADTTCPPALALDAVTLNPTTVVGGERNATGTVTLTGNATSSFKVDLSSSDTQAATVPSSVTVFSGQQTKTFTVTSKSVTAPKTVTITAKSGTVTKTATLTVEPNANAAPAVDSVAIEPTRVPGGGKATGTVTLASPAGPNGAVVALSGTAPNAASVPASATVAANQTTATFEVGTSSVAIDTPVVITASTGGGGEKTARLMVLTTDRECNRSSSDPTTETLKARSFGAYDDSGKNVDCGVVVQFENGITVGPGTTGLAEGTPVQLSVTLRFDGSLYTSPPVISGGTTAEGTSQYRITDDDVPPTEEVSNVVAEFQARYNLQQYVPFPNSENVTWQSDHYLETNATERQDGRDRADYHSPDAVGGTKDTGNLTASYNTTVGAHLTIKGRVSTIASAYGTGASAVADFSNTFKAETVPAPGYEGLALTYDTSPPPANQPPVCTAGTVTVAEDTTVTVTPYCTDPDGDALTYTVVNGPAHGTLSTSLVYTPQAGYSGSDSFTYKANDGKADSAVATVGITVTPVNDVPVCDNTTGATDEGQPIAVAFSCTDPEGDPLTYSVKQAPANGTVNGLTYTPDPGFVGTDSLTYAASDGKGGEATATYTVTVRRVLVGPPTDAEQCKNGGWQRFNNPSFPNQGQCVSYVA